MAVMLKAMIAGLGWVSQFTSLHPGNAWCITSKQMPVWRVS